MTIFPQGMTWVKYMIPHYAGSPHLGMSNADIEDPSENQEKK